MKIHSAEMNQKYIYQTYPFGLNSALTNPSRSIGQLVARGCCIGSVAERNSFMDLTPTECLCLVCLALVGGVTAFLTSSGAQAILHEIALTIRADRRAVERGARWRRRGEDRSPERE